MTDMDAARHDEPRQMSGAYVLGALEPAERDEFAAHLLTCAECAAEVRGLSEVASALPYAVPQIDPPLALRQRVLAVLYTPYGFLYEKTPLHRPLGMYLHLWRPDVWDTKGNPVLR